jgi:hypothetical protein
MARQSIDFPPATLPQSAERIRQQVRAFVKAERESGRIDPVRKSGMSFNAALRRAAASAPTSA